MIQRIAIVAVITASLLLSACSARVPPDEVTSSSLVVELTQAELVAHADWIVVGTVTGKESLWSADRGNIYTLVTVSVEEWVKGGPGENEIVITTPGGQVGETTEVVEDAAGFQEGERVLVYLQLNDDGTASVVGGWQGQFVVTKNGKVARGELSLSNLSLADVISQIKAEIGKQSK
ncbi:MAG: hypothetical protein H8E40_13855 [Chloroflexi bacterium]|nr:hypothetical protein [Chloroflexota bacterium]